MARKAYLDIETRSTVDLKAAGAYAYAEHPETEVLLLSFAFDDGPCRTVRLTLDRSPADVYRDALDLVRHVRDGGTVVAHNVEFERAIWGRILGPRYGWPAIRLDQWDCTAARSAALSLPRSLEDAAIAIGLGVEKDQEGRRLMLRMSKPLPRRGKDKDAGGPPIYQEDEASLQRLSEYCEQDVAVTQAIDRKLPPLPEEERAIWLLDAEINERGVYIDKPLVEAAWRVVQDTERAMTAELRLLTSGAVESVKQVQKFRDYCAAHGIDLPSLTASDVNAALERTDLPANVRRALEIRRALGRSSTAKLSAMLARRNRDGRARGNLLYHGASTGRWAGSGIQLQNMPRGEIKKAERCIPAIMTGEYKAVEALWGDPLTVVSSTLRSMIRAADGNVLYVADFSNIEGRGLAWLAGEQWKIAAFEAYDRGQGPDIYKLAFSKSFGVPVERVDSDQRQVGKVQELACGYGGGVGAYQAMAGNYGLVIEDERAKEITRAWRQAHPRTVAFWRELEDAAIMAVRDPGSVQKAGELICFYVEGSFLKMRLPSGRCLAYPRPRIIQKNGWYGPQDVVSFMSSKPGAKGMPRDTTYGGKLAENATQAVARDVMRDAMLRLADQGYSLILSVHDEVIAEEQAGWGGLKEFEQVMAGVPRWARGFPIAVEGWTGERYRK